MHEFTSQAQVEQTEGSVILREENPTPHSIKLAKEQKGISKEKR